MSTFIPTLVVLAQVINFPTGIYSLSDLCIQNFYGRNANRIITLANALKESYRRNLSLALDEKWSSWYSSWFDKHDKIKINHFGSCSVKLEAKFLYSLEPLYKFNSEISYLRPKQRYWKRAIQELNLNGKNVVTVHRRWLEGECAGRAKRREYFCKSPLDFSKSCFWTQSDISELVRNLVRRKSLQQQQKILLFTDQQNLEFDKTFRFQMKKQFQVEMCMMALSSAHFGNPMSSIDYVVAHWREGMQFPLECFAQIHN